MRLDQLPLVKPVVEAGPDDRVFDALLLAGPPILLGIAILGRTVVTTALATGYLVAFLGYVVSTVWRSEK